MQLLLITYFLRFSTQSRHGPDGERFRYTLAMVFIQCIVNAIFARLGKIALLIS